MFGLEIAKHRLPPMEMIGLGYNASGNNAIVLPGNSAVGDLIHFWTPLDNPGLVSGWTTNTSIFSGYGYSSTYGYRLLANTSNITIASGSYGLMWTLIRGPTSCIFVANNNSSGTSLSISFPAKDATCEAKVVYLSDRDASGGPTTSSGWTKANFAPSGAFTNEIAYNMDYANFANSHVTTFTGFLNSSFDQTGVGFEYRR